MKSRYKGIVFIVCSAFCFALMNLFVRLSGDLPSIQKSFSGIWWHFSLHSF